ncbi:4Fe-4S binding protein [candidate division KSB1 bacterium]|nr:4Fe-4S binding protein [candidate division KSB1 bacterium]
MEAKKNYPTIEINTAWCKGCSICIEFCPNAVLALNNLHATVVNLEACTACKLCEIRCPDFAITVTKNE